MRIGGKILIKADGFQYRARGSWIYNLGVGVRTGVAGADSVHGYTENPQVPFMEGVITDGPDISAEELRNLKDATITLDLANGKTIVLKNAWFAGEGDQTTGEGEIAARFEGISCNEVR